MNKITNELNLHTLAEQVDNAAYTAQTISQLSAQGEALTLEQAYKVQDLSVARRLSRGEKQVGIKMGFTSRAKMIQMGVDDMIWGPLTDRAGWYPDDRWQTSDSTGRNWRKYPIDTGFLGISEQSTPNKYRF